MKRLLAVIICATLFPLPATAEPIPVQSGEHAAFSRIVTPLRDAEWSVAQDGRKVTLQYVGVSDTFDISEVFDLIPRDRIQSVQTNAGELTLSLNCDCAVSAVTERGAFVVIDVADDRAALESPERMVAGVDQTTTTEPDATARQNAPFVPKRPPSADREPSGWQPDIIPPGNIAAVDALQRRLAQELKTATRRGVLSPNRGNQNQAPAASWPADAPSRKGDQTVTQSPPDPVPPRNLGNLRISTSRDLPRTFRDLTEITNQEGQVCPPNSTLAVATWGDDRPFAEQIVQARQGLFGEFDRINPKAAKRLAQTYLYFGFGAEAREVLRLDPLVTEKSPLLLTMARIVDGDAVPPKNALSDLIECRGDAALWSTLVAPIPPAGALPKSDDALRTLSGLPRHLRVLLAPKLHSVLLAYGDPAGAATALRILERVPGELDSAARIALAKGKLERGDTDQAAEALAEVVQENAEQSPTALIALVNTKLKQKKPISVETSRLVDAYAQELRGTALGPEFERIQILALAQSGQFDAAFSQLSNSRDLPESVAPQVLALLTKDASDIVFLEHALGRRPQDISASPQNAVLALGNRLLALGFASDAELALSVLPSPPRQPEHKMLSAKISLAMGKPFRAQAELLNLDDETANRLRADAKRMSGAHDEAHVLYDQINSPQEAKETAWLSEDWRSLTDLETPAFGPAAVLPRSPGASAETDGMLARTSALLEQSVQARETMSELLNSDAVQLGGPSE